MADVRADESESMMVELMVILLVASLVNHWVVARVAEMAVAKAALMVVSMAE